MIERHKKTYIKREWEKIVCCFFIKFAGHSPLIFFIKKVFCFVLFFSPFGIISLLHSSSPAISVNACRTLIRMTSPQDFVSLCVEAGQLIKHKLHPAHLQYGQHVQLASQHVSVTFVLTTANRSPRNWRFLWSMASLQVRPHLHPNPTLCFLTFSNIWFVILIRDCRARSVSKM